MKSARFLALACAFALAANAFAVYTPHIGGSAGSTIYVKGPRSGGPDNSPLHESWNLTDEFIDSTPNPNHLGLYFRFIFYDGTLHIDPTGKVGFTEKMFASGNDPNFWGDGVPQMGTVNVEGILFGTELRPWKNGCPMTVNVMCGELILDLCRIGVSDGGTNTGVVNLSGGLAKFDDFVFFGPNSYMDITGGELLTLTSNYDVAGINGLIGANLIRNTSGEGLLVQLKTIEGVDYTSVMLIPEPATVLMLGLGGLALMRRRRA